MPRLECENDARGRFTAWPGPDSHAAHRISADATASYASSARPVVARRADEADTGATPQAEGLVRARNRVCFHNSAPALQGSLPVHGSLGGKAIERRWERGGSTDRAALRASARRPSTRPRRSPGRALPGAPALARKRASSASDTRAEAVRCGDQPSRRAPLERGPPGGQRGHSPSPSPCRGPAKRGPKG